MCLFVPLQRLKFFGVLEELELLKKVPDLDALGFTAFNANDNLTFSSHAWTITIDPNSGEVMILLSLCMHICVHDCKALL